MLNVVLIVLKVVLMITAKLMSRVFVLSVFVRQRLYFDHGGCLNLENEYFIGFVNTEIKSCKLKISMMI